MKILKRIGIGLLAIVLLIVIIGLFMPSSTIVEKSIVVKAPVETVFDQVNTLTNWKKWSPWYKMDTTAIITYNNKPSGNGASYSWDSKNSDVGAGTMTLSDVKQNEHITENMVFKDRGEGKATMDFATEAKGVKITWKMEMDHGWNPFMRIMGALFIKGMLGKQFDEGLQGIKDAAEHAPILTSSGKSYRVTQIELKPGQAVVMPGKIKAADFTSYFGTALPAAGAFIKKNNLKQTGPPFAIYYNYNPTGFTDLDAGMPFEGTATASGLMKIIELKGGNAVKVDYYGGYMGIGSAHEAIDKWLKANDAKAVGPAWEVYATDPGTEKDSTKWLTEVIYPIK